MEILLTFVLTVMLCWLVYLSMALIRARKLGHKIITHKVTEAAEAAQSAQTTLPDIGSTELLCQSLKSLKIDVQKDEEGRICFEYEKNNFVIEVSDESLIISIWDVWWAGVDIKEANTSKIQDAINVSNMENTVMTFYSIDEEKNLFGFHSKYDLVFSPTVPNNDVLLKAVLDAFLKVQEDITENISKLNASEAIKTTNERVKIKGFRR